MCEGKRVHRFTLWVDDDLRDRVERIALDREKLAGVRLARADIVRLVIARGLECIERGEIDVDPPSRARV